MVLSWVMNLGFAAGGAVGPRTGTDWYAAVAVASAGTAVQFTTAPVPVKRIYFMAPSGNTGDVYLGGSDVSSTVMGRLFEPGDRWVVDFSEGRWGNLSEFYVDAANAGDEIRFLAVTVGG